jgi:hypothetical protein
MASLFTPDVPKQDPAVARQQQQEQARAESARISATQDQLRTETMIRGRSSGIRSLLGSFGSSGSGGPFLGSG